MRSSVNIIVIDDFYQNPDAVREFALRQEFKVRGNYPGQRTESFLNDGLKDSISKILEPHAGKVTYWGDNGSGVNYTGAFQYVTSLDRSWIHSDGTTTWAGVCYLTPDAPITAGTGLFRHKATGLRGWNYGQHTKEETDNNPANKETQDYTKWEMTDMVGNIYNRLVLYRGDMYHVSLDYFGTDKYDGRLFQTFFIDTEK